MTTTSNKLEVAVKAQDQACRDAYEILMDLYATLGRDGLRRALLSVGVDADEREDWITQINETRAAYEDATEAITKIVAPRT